MPGCTCTQTLDPCRPPAPAASRGARMPAFLGGGSSKVSSPWEGSTRRGEVAESLAANDKRTYGMHTPTKTETPAQPQPRPRPVCQVWRVANKKGPSLKDESGKEEGLQMGYSAAAGDLKESTFLEAPLTSRQVNS
eukprot:GHVU01041046.1.p3 GENE.GHVU01041046.1~~GHVU01041046.1.p3  ORF type:complete len:136 (-),score=11.57 GHVU01041046.1:38-445(-)